MERWVMGNNGYREYGQEAIWSYYERQNRKENY